MTLSHHYIAITQADRFLDWLTISLWTGFILTIMAILVTASWKHEPKD